MDPSLGGSPTLGTGTIQVDRCHIETFLKFVKISSLGSVVLCSVLGSWALQNAFMECVNFGRKNKHPWK